MAHPERYDSPIVSDSSVGRLVEDIFRRIFLLIRDGDAHWLCKWVAVGTIISRLSSHWRAIAFSDHSLWSDIFIGPTSPRGMTRTVLERSGKHNLRVVFCVPGGAGGLKFTGFSAEFNASLQMVMAQSVRWDSISVISPFFPLFQISKMLSQIPLPELQSMELVRSDTAAILYCGPFMLDSVIFRHLILDGVVIRLAHSSQFSGLRSLSIVNTGFRMLDKRFLRSTTTPTELPPSMSIEHLSISAPFLAYVPPILSLNPSTLVSLKLSGLSANDLSLQGTLVSLTRELLTENLRSLELADTDSAAVALFLSSLRGRNFAGLDVLTVVPKVDLTGLEPDIQSIFPNLTDFLPT